MLKKISGLILAVWLACAAAAGGQTVLPHWLALAGGDINGMYYLVGNIISVLVSAPPGGLDCGDGGSCGIEDTVVMNISTEGSLANLTMLTDQQAQIAFAQSDISYWAYTGSGLFAHGKAQQQLRAIASLYPEMLHLVVAKDSDIKSIADLRGKKVALGSQGSGTLVNVRELLHANGLSEQDLSPNYDELARVVEAFLHHDIAGFFFVGGIPTPLITFLAKRDEIRLVPIVSDEMLFEHNQYCNRAVIPAYTYPGIGRDIPTVAVHALLLTRAEVDDSRIYQFTKSLWQDENLRPYWVQGLLPALALRPEHALDGIGIPLHPGAKRYYDEIGKRF